VSIERDRITGDGVAMRAAGVVRSFRDTRALEGVHLEVPEGGFFLLAGRNGAGKSTLIRLFLDLLPPTSGELSVLGLDPTRQGARVRAATGYVPEDGSWPFPRMTVRRFLDHHAAYRPWWDPAYERFLAGAFELPLERRVGELSKGEFRRAQITAALAHRPPLLVLDEPTDGLDPLMRERLGEILADHLSSSPATVLVSTHLVEQMEGFADHLAVLREGRMGPILTRERLRSEGRRIHISAPDGWVAPTPSSGRVLRREGRGGEELWVTLGDEVALRAEVERAGARIVDSRPLTLDEAAVALLGESE
jgi:ABC-2 type transport system ATP-binding protein